MPSLRSARSAAFRLRELLGVVLVAALGCEIASFDVIRRGSATIPAEGTGPIEMMTLDDLELELAELEDEQGIGTEDISDARLRRLTLEVTDPQGGDLAFVDRIEVFAEAPGLGRTRVASLDDPPAGVSEVELAVDDVDLQSYVAAPTVTLVAVIDGTAPATDVRVRGTAKLEIGVTVRGACDHG